MKRLSISRYCQHPFPAIRDNPGPSDVIELTPLGKPSTMSGQSITRETHGIRSKENLELTQNDCSRDEKSGIHPVLRPGLSLGCNQGLAELSLCFYKNHGLSRWSSMLDFSSLSSDNAMAHSVSYGTGLLLPTRLRIGREQEVP
jgi:hypothetical protein